MSKEPSVIGPLRRFAAMLIVSVFVFAACELQQDEAPLLPEQAHERYGDARDSIVAVPKEEDLAYFESYGLTRKMFEDPSIMTDEDER
ncbi:MAG: hypothetical protein ACOC2Y_04215 [Spirochaetota bacterium]